MPFVDSYTEEFAKIVTGEVIWCHQRCIVCKNCVESMLIELYIGALQCLKSTSFI
jgi:hypothetical protein